MIAHGLIGKACQRTSRQSFNISGKRLAMSLCLILSFALGAWSQSSHLIIVGTTGGASITTIASSLGGTVVDSMPGGIYLMRVPKLPTSLPVGVSYIEENSNAVLLAVTGAATNVNTTTAPDFYNSQPISKLLEYPDAKAHSTGNGIVVADIDSLVDYSHPALRGHLTSGYDFVIG